MSRRSNSTKQKYKAGSAPSSSSEVPGLPVAESAESSRDQKEMFAASLLETLNSVREVGGVFSDFNSVNSEILQSTSATSSSLKCSVSFVAEEAEGSGPNAVAKITAVLDRNHGELECHADFGADIFADAESVLSQAASDAVLPQAVLQELKVSESTTVVRDDLEEEVRDVDIEEIFEVRTDSRYPIDSPLHSSPVTAIDAAVEILSQVVDTENVHRVASSNAKVQLQKAQSGVAERSESSVGSLHNELKELTEALRYEFRQSIESLQASQAAANAAQSEVLKTLTEIMFQSAGSRDTPADAIEKAFSGVEERLMACIHAATGAAILSQNSSTPASPGPIATGTGPGNPMKLQNAASSVTRSWEQIKSEMMNKGELIELTSASRAQKVVTALPEVAQLTSDRHFRLPEQDLSLEIPKTIDPEAISDQDLRDAFREREAFITTLIARIRRQQESATGQLSPDQLRTLAEELPEELAEQVQHTLKQMDDLARMGELELSLERARIARQVNQLAHSHQLLERNARQMGMIVNADGTIVHGPNQAGRGSGSRRWLGKLGFGQ